MRNLMKPWALVLAAGAAGWLAASAAAGALVPDGGTPATSLAQLAPPTRNPLPASPPPVAPPPAAAPPAAPGIAVPAVGPFSLVPNATGFTATSLAFRLGPAAYVVPRMEISGTSLSRDELIRLLDPGSDAPIAERLGRLQAASIVVPELFSSVEAGGGRQIALYRDLRLDGLGAGRLASVASAGGIFEGTGRANAARGTFSRMELAGVDLSLAAALFNEKAGDGKGELRPVYASFALEGLASLDERGAGVRVARIAGRDILARRTKDGWTETMRLISAAPDAAALSAEDRSRSFNALADLFEAFEIGAMEATGIVIQEPRSRDTVGRIARIAYRGGAGRPAEFAIESLEAGNAENRVQIASLAVNGFSIAPALDAAREMAGRKPGEISGAELRRMVPGLQGFRVAGVEIETKAAGQPQRVSLGGIELTAEKPVEGIPSDIRLAIRNIVAPVGAQANDGARQLAELGYERLDASLAANVAWNEAGQEIVLRELSARGADMGSLMLRGVVGNVTRDLFAPDQALASVAMVGATVKSLDIGIENAGLFERVIAREARRQRKSPDDIRRDYGMAAAIGVPVMLGNSAAAKTLGQALGRFVAKPGRLAIQLRVKDPAGLGFADFAGSPDPGSLLEKVEVTATAE